MKRWCIWCERGNDSKSDYLWIHNKCFFDFWEQLQNLQGVKQRLDEGKSFPEIVEYIKGMQEFSRKWNNIMEGIGYFKKV